MDRGKLQNHAPASMICCLALVLTAFCVQGCFLAAVPLATEAEGATTDVAPSGAWDLFKVMAGGPSAMQMEATHLEISSHQQQLKANAAEKQRSESARAATIGVLQDLWNWQHDPAIGDLLIYVKAGGDPSVAMQAAMQRTRWEARSAALCRAESEPKPVAQSSVAPKQHGTD
jgi:hypothetical protein